MSPAAGIRGTLADRVSARLTPDRLLVYPAAVIVLFVVVWVVSLRTAFPLPDHLARWTAGSMVVHGNVASLYDPAAQSRLQVDVGADRLSWFVSPPYVALLFVPFGLLPYPVSGVVWTLLSMALLAWSARAVAGLNPRFSALGTGRGMLLAASCQPVLELVGGGQDTALVVAALVGGVRLVALGRAFAGGVLLGVMVVKPQLAVLVPVALLALRAWRAVAGTAVTVLVLGALATVLLGPGVWWAWPDALSSPLYLTEVQQTQAWKNTTLFGLAESLTPDAVGVAALVVWAAAALTVAVLTWRWWRGSRPDAVPLLLVMVPLVTVLVTPHGMVYELVLLLPAAAWWCAPADAARPRALTAVAYVLLFLAPLLHLVALTVPGLALLDAPWVVAPLLAVWWGMVRGPRASRPMAHEVSAAG